MIQEIVREPLTVYHFSGELRKPTIKVVAMDQHSAVAAYLLHAGLPSGTVILPRQEVPFEPALHMKGVLYAGNDPDLLRDLPPVMPERKQRNGKGKYSNADASEFPLLSYFGKGSISPEWTINRKTGKVEPSGEFESFPSYFLDLSDKPTAHEVQASGGKYNPGGGLDVQARFLNDSMPWLQLESGEDLRSKLLDEIEKYERRAGI